MMPNKIRRVKIGAAAISAEKANPWPKREYV
jgi:hypothetical protein